MAFVRRFVVALLLSWTSASIYAAQDPIEGTWLTEAADSKVQIAPNGSAYVGKVIWLKQPERDGKPVADVKNADTAQRGRPIMGMPVLPVLTGNADGYNGTIYSPQKGRSYPVEVSVTKDGRLDLKVKDGIFSKHIQWTRAQ